MSEPQPKPFPSVPAIGSDKQDGFARILAHKLALSLPAFEAILKTETGRDPLPVFPHYYSKQEGGKIIDHLLAKCKLAGIEISTRKGGRGGARGRARQQQEQHRQENGSGGEARVPVMYGTNDELLAELAARVDAGKISNAHLLAVLEKRGCSGTIAHASVNDCAARLEALGYPGEAMKANPDLLGQAGNLGRLLLEVLMSGGLARGTIEQEMKDTLRNAGLLAE